MELLPLGPVLIIDTPGLDDEGTLGEKRVRQTRKVLNKVNVAVLVVDAAEGMRSAEEEIIALFEARRIPHVIAYNKSDLSPQRASPDDGHSVCVSALTGDGIDELKERIARCGAGTAGVKSRIVGDLISPGDFVVLVIPIDKAAPKGRLILPQQQVIRDVLDSDASAITVKETGLSDALKSLGKKPRLVITDSQVFAKAGADTPPDVPLTSFSILFARYKGDLAQNVKGVRALGSIKDGDKILICEACTHHRQCDDIGTVKLPQWIRDYTGAAPEFDFTSGGDFPGKLSTYGLIVHCGGCMLNEREMKYRLAQAGDAAVPMTNYGVLIAYTQDILRRALASFPDIISELDEE
jgi:[FeFe] hydrogenase H-cluster maturation GTPase HydF